MTTVTIAQRKGGNGKSTATVNLAACFAEQGKRVLVIDLDDQKNTTSAMSHERPRATIEDLLIDEGVTLCDAAVATSLAGVSVVASSSTLSGAIRELDREVGGHRVLAERLADARDYDLCLIDTAPSLSILVVNALCASRYLFIPLSSQYFSLHGLAQTCAAADKVRMRLHGELETLGGAFVIHDGRSSLAREVIEKARDEYGGMICEATVSRAIAVEEAQALREPVIAYAPGHRAAGQYRALASELLGRMKG